MLQICIYLCIPWRVEWNVVEIWPGISILVEWSAPTTFPPFILLQYYLQFQFMLQFIYFARSKKSRKNNKENENTLKARLKNFSFFIKYMYIHMYVYVYAIWIYIFGNNMKWKLHFEIQYDGVWMVEGVYSFVRVYTLLTEWNTNPQLLFYCWCYPRKCQCQPHCSQQCFHSFILFWEIVMFSLALFKEFLWFGKRNTTWKNTKFSHV